MQESHLLATDHQLLLGTVRLLPDNHPVSRRGIVCWLLPNRRSPERRV